MGSRETRRIRTRAGPLELYPASVEDLRGIARHWPMELVADSEDFSSFGLVFQHGQREVHGVKMQPPDASAREAMTALQVHRAVVAAALPAYLERGHLGVMVPCAYCKEKDGGNLESGLVFFVGPDSASRPESPTPNDVLYDDQIGPGATRMIRDMLAAIGSASRDFGLPLCTIIGMDLGPRLAFGSLAMDFVVAGPQIVAVKPTVQDEDPVWEFAARSGLLRLPHAPMRPAGFDEDTSPNGPHHA